VLLIDVETLGEAAFGEGRLRELLESTRVSGLGLGLGLGSGLGAAHISQLRVRHLLAAVEVDRGEHRQASLSLLACPRPPRCGAVRG
jgi:hypothetical protein